MELQTATNLIFLYWLYAFMSAMLFWYKEGWSVLFPLSASAIGWYLFVSNPDLFSFTAQGIFLIAIFSIEVVFIKYSFHKNSEEKTSIHS